jgi:hypothetical protein
LGRREMRDLKRKKILNFKITLCPVSRRKRGGWGDWYNRGGVGRDKKVTGSRSQGEEEKTRIKKRLGVEGRGGEEISIMRRRDIIYSHLIRRRVGTGGPSARTHLLVSLNDSVSLEIEYKSCQSLTLHVTPRNGGRVILNFFPISARLQKVCCRSLPHLQHLRGSSPMVGELPLISEVV